MLTDQAMNYSDSFDGKEQTLVPGNTGMEDCVMGLRDFKFGYKYKYGEKCRFVMSATVEMLLKVNSLHDISSYGTSNGASKMQGIGKITGQATKEPIYPSGITWIVELTSKDALLILPDGMRTTIMPEALMKPMI